MFRAMAKPWLNISHTRGAYKILLPRLHPGPFDWDLWSGVLASVFKAPREFPWQPELRHPCIKRSLKRVILNSGWAFKSPLWGGGVKNTDARTSPQRVDLFGDKSSPGDSKAGRGTSL